MASNFQIGNNKIELLKEYESVTQKILIFNALLSALMSGRKYNVYVKIIFENNRSRKPLQ
jgi:hypothetical protein